MHRECTERMKPTETLPRTLAQLPGWTPQAGCDTFVDTERFAQPPPTEHDFVDPAASDRSCRSDTTTDSRANADYAPFVSFLTHIEVVIDHDLDNRWLVFFDGGRSALPRLFD